MANEIIEKQEELYNKIMNLLSSSKVESTDEVISLLDVRNSLSYIMNGYNKLLVDDTNNQIISLNENVGHKKSSFKNKKLKKINKIINYNTINNDSYIKIFFNDDNTILLGMDENNMIKILDTSFEFENTDEFVFNNYEMFESNFKLLNSFKERYPNQEIYFTKSKSCADDINPNNQIFSNGFVTCKTDLTNPKNMTVSFENFEDTIISTLHSKKYGELYDYIALYNDEILSKIPVNINDLKPLLKLIYKDYVDLNKGKSFTLNK